VLDVEDLAELLEVLDQGANLNLTRQQQNLQQFFLMATFLLEGSSSSCLSSLSIKGKQIV